MSRSDARVARTPSTESLDATNQIHRKAPGLDALTSSPTDFQITDYEPGHLFRSDQSEGVHEFIFR